MVTPRAEHLQRSGRLERNLLLLCGYRALQMTMFPVAIVTLYWSGPLHLSMTEIFVIQALFGLFAAVLEFPGGYLGDRIGYRRAMQIATVCSASGWLVLGFADGFWSILVGELLLAGSLALTSGTDAALMYESLLGLDREQEFGRWFGRSRSIGAASEGTAALVVGLLYAVSPQLPFFLQAAVAGVNAVLAFMLLEPPRQVGDDVPVWTRVRTIFHFAAIRSQRLRASIIAVLVLGLATFVPVWIIAIYAARAGVQAPWIGPIWAAANYIVALGFWTSDRASEAVGVTGLLLLAIGLIAVGFVGLGMSHALWGFAFYYAICLGRGLNGPALTHIQQRLIPSSDRASLLSINSLLFRGAFFVLGPLVGLGVDRLGEHSVLLLSGVLAVPLCTLAVVRLARVPR
jgi:MFS family permease